jgi:hypothetical protein
VLATKVDNISDEYMFEDDMGGSKEYIKHDIFLKHPKNIMEAMQFACHIQAKKRDTHNYTTGTCVGRIFQFGDHRGTLPQPT